MSFQFIGVKTLIIFLLSTAFIELVKVKRTFWNYYELMAYGSSLGHHNVCLLPIFDCDISFIQLTESLLYLFLVGTKQHWAMKIKFLTLRNNGWPLMGFKLWSLTNSDYLMPQDFFPDFEGSPNWFILGKFKPNFFWNWKIHHPQASLHTTDFFS